MGDPFPFVLAGSNCQPFVKSEHRPSGGSRPFAWWSPGESESHCASFTPSEPNQAHGMLHRAWAALVERQEQKKWQMKGISHHTGNNRRAWDQAFCRQLVVAHRQYKAWFHTFPWALSLFQACIPLHLDRYMWQSKVGWPVAISFFFIGSYPYRCFPNILQAPKWGSDPKVLCLMV